VHGRNAPSAGAARRKRAAPKDRDHIRVSQGTHIVANAFCQSEFFASTCIAKKDAS